MDNNIYINNERFSAADVEISFLGKVSTGVTKLSYTDTNPIDDVSVVGNRKAAGFVRGNQTCSGSLEMLEDEWRTLGLAAPDGDVKKINPFDITITVFNSSQGIKKTVLKGCMFKGKGFDTSAGSADAIKSTSDLRIGDIVNK